ncbi:2875_t:CDS:2, partial [Cetraspora pellucida]
MSPSPMTLIATTTSSTVPNVSATSLTTTNASVTQNVPNQYSDTQQYSITPFFNPITLNKTTEYDKTNDNSNDYEDNESNLKKRKGNHFDYEKDQYAYSCKIQQKQHDEQIDIFK